MQTFASIQPSAKLSIQQSSPSQEFFPILSNHGYFTLTPGLMTTPTPTFAPNDRSIQRRAAEKRSSEDRSSGSPEKNHAIWTTLSPPGWYQSFRKLRRLTSPAITTFQPV